MSPSDTPRQTKAERRDAAREEARRLKEEQARRERRNRLLLVSGLVALVALVVVAVVAIIGSGGTKSLADVESPAGSDASGGIVTGADGVGSTNDGAPTVQVYSDFLCPFCALFEGVNGPVLAAAAADGRATVIYHPVAFLDRLSEGTAYSTRAAQAAAVVADAAPEQFVAFQEALFANQPEENTPGLTDEQIAQIAVDAGVPQDVADTFVDGRFTDWVTAATAQASADLDRPATPTVLIDGEVWAGDWQDPAALEDAIGGVSAPTDVATTPAG